MAEALTPIPDLVPAKTKRALELLSERAHQAEQLAQTMDAQYQKAAGEAASLEQQLEQTKAAKDAEIQALGDEKANMEAGYKQQLKTRDDLVTQLRTEKRAAEDAAQEAKDQLAAATADFSRDKLAMEATVTQLREKVRIIEAKAEEPDGFIVAFDNKTGYGSVNLGRIDHVQTGMIFQVYRLGRGGQITLTFNPPIEDGEGWDFAVFENVGTTTDSGSSDHISQNTNYYKSAREFLFHQF